MLPASPAIAGARREPEPLHLLLTGIGRLACFCFVWAPQLFRALPALLQYNRCTLHHVERALIASDFLLQGRGALWTRQTYCVAVEFYAQSLHSVHADAQNIQQPQFP